MCFALLRAIVDDDDDDGGGGGIRCRLRCATAGRSWVRSRRRRSRPSCSPCGTFCTTRRLRPPTTLSRPTSPRYLHPHTFVHHRHHDQTRFSSRLMVLTTERAHCHSTRRRATTTRGSRWRAMWTRSCAPCATCCVRTWARSPSTTPDSSSQSVVCDGGWDLNSGWCPFVHYTSSHDCTSGTTPTGRHDTTQHTASTRKEAQQKKKQSHNRGEARGAQESKGAGGAQCGLDLPKGRLHLLKLERYRED